MNRNPRNCCVALALSSLFASATAGTGSADAVYSSEAGHWKMAGYLPDGDVDYPSCVISTTFLSGVALNLNIFPTAVDQVSSTLTVRNPAWRNVDTDGSPVDINFWSAKYGFKEAQGYPEKYAGSKIIFRRLNDNFARAFTRYDTMTMFASTQDELEVSLKGTSALTEIIEECIITVLGGNPDPE